MFELENAGNFHVVAACYYRLHLFIVILYSVWVEGGRYRLLFFGIGFPAEHKNLGMVCTRSMGLLGYQQVIWVSIGKVYKVLRIKIEGCKEDDKR